MVWVFPTFGVHVKVYGGDPAPGLAVAVPTPWEQISFVILTFTEPPPVVNQVVSLVTEPRLALHAVADKKYPVVPDGTGFTFKTPLLYGKV